MDTAALQGVSQPFNANSTTLTLRWEGAYELVSILVDRRLRRPSMD